MLHSTRGRQPLARMSDRRASASRAPCREASRRLPARVLSRILATQGVFLICPRCRSDQCRRSKRRRLRDYLVGVSGARPWRCRSCELRFFAWVVPVTYVMYVHCKLCGNLDLQHISSEYVYESRLAWLGRLLHLPAYRCDPCRYRFFSLRANRRIRAVRAERAAS